MLAGAAREDRLLALRGEDIGYADVRPRRCRSLELATASRRSMSLQRGLQPEAASPRATRAILTASVSEPSSYSSDSPPRNRALTSSPLKFASAMTRAESTATRGDVYTRNQRAER